MTGSDIETMGPGGMVHDRDIWRHRPEDLASCPVEHALAIIGGRWTSLIVRELLAGTKRFGDLRRGLGGVAAKTLTERLRLLEDQGIVERKAYAEVPPRVEYTLTERGLSLEPILKAMWGWGASDMRAQDGQPTDARST